MKKLLLSFALLIVTFSQAQLSIDNTYLGNGKLNNTVAKLVKQPDNKIIAIGSFTKYDTTDRRQIVRLNQDGSLDTSFDPGSSVGTGTINSVEVLSNGKIMIGGYFVSYNGSATTNLARLNSDGTLDTTFTTSPFSFSNGSTGAIYTIKEQADGKILIGGWFEKHGITNRSGIARLNSDGTLDTTFNPGLGVQNGSNGNHFVHKAIVTPTADIYIGGRYGSFNNLSTSSITKLSSTGTTLTPLIEGTSNLDVVDIALQPDGKILICGSFTSVNSAARGRIARLNTNGTLDNSFGVTNGGTNGWVRTIKLLPSGQVLIAGAFTKYNDINANKIALLSSTGTLNNSFNSSNLPIDHMIESIEVENSNNSIIIAGQFTSVNNNNTDYKYLVRLISSSVVLGTDEVNHSNSKINIYPNPTTDQLTINTNEAIKSVSIFSANGQLVKQDKSKQINVGQLTSGKYTIQVETKEGTHTNHFIKK